MGVVEDRREYEQAIGLPTGPVIRRFTVMALCLLGWHEVAVAQVLSDVGPEVFAFGGSDITVNKWRMWHRESNGGRERYCGKCATMTTHVSAGLRANKTREV